MACSRPHSLRGACEGCVAAQPGPSTRRPLQGSAANMAGRWGPHGHCVVSAAGSGQASLGWGGCLPAEAPSPLLLLTLQLLGDFFSQNI